MAFYKKNKFLFIIQYDSFIKNLIPVINYLINNNQECEVILYQSFFKKRWLTSSIKHEISHLPYIYTVRFNKIKKQIKMNNYDIIVMGTIGSALIERVYHCKKQLNLNSIKMASGYIGVLLENKMDAFYEGVKKRSITNLIWAPGDYDVKKIIDSGLINKSNTKVVATGLPSFDKLFSLKETIKPRNKKNVIFLEQPTFPKTITERTILVKKLVKYAKENIDVNVIIKPRFIGKVGHAHRPKFLLQDIIKKIPNIPSNIKFSYDDIYTLYQNSKMALTISSTAGIESLLVGIPTYFITDFCGMENTYGSNDFKKYNTCITFDDLFKNKLPAINYNKIKDEIKFDGNNTKRLANELIQLKDNDNDFDEIY